MMNRVVVCAAVLGMALTCGVATAQAEPGVPDNILSEFKYLVGTWEFAGNIADEKFAGTVSYKWAKAKGKGKNPFGLVANWMFEVDGKPVTSVGVLGWNSAKERIVECSFSSGGGAVMLYYSVESPGHWKGEFSDVKDGEEVKGNGEVVKQGADRFVYEGVATNGNTARLVFEKMKK